MKHLFIFNPKAGSKKNGKNDYAEKIRMAAERRNLDYEIYWTTEPMDACRKIKEAAADGNEYRVYACGGDGTFNECVNGAVGCSNVFLTLLPVGTGNDFVKMFGADGEKFRDIDALLDGTPCRMDVIDCNGRYGANICSVGIDARIGTQAHNYGNVGVWGYIASLVVNIIKGINQKLTIITPEGEETKDFALICICNGRYYGGMFNPLPEAMPGDGFMDCLIVDEVTRLAVPGLLSKYSRGRYREIPEKVKYLKLREITIKSDEEFVINVDGEAIWGREATFRMVHNGLNFILPKGIDNLSFGLEKCCVSASYQEI